MAFADCAAARSWPSFAAAAEMRTLWRDDATTRRQGAANEPAEIWKHESVGVVNIDPFEVFGEELMAPLKKGEVIAQLQRLPLSDNLKRTTYARWCERVGVPKDELDFRAVQRRNVQ